VVALIRTHTAPRNSQFGGPLGGGAIVYAGKTGDGAEAGSRPRRGAAGTEAGTEIEGNFTVYPAQPDPASALRRYLHHNPPGREGRQWLFVARLLLAEGHPLGAARRLWRGYLWPLVASLREAVATHWALTSTVELEARTGRVRLTAQPAHTDGSIPAWAARLAAVREYAVEDSGLRVIDELGTQRAPPEIGRAAEETARPGQGLRLRYVLPAAAQGLQISASEPVRRAGPGERWIELRPQSTAFSLRLTYVL
jgi:hypothetical protein